MYHLFYIVTELNECASSPCDNDGTCEDRVNNLTCTCLPQWHGYFCNGTCFVWLFGNIASFVQVFGTIASFAQLFG